jgi:hypothetical protein
MANRSRQPSVVVLVVSTHTSGSRDANGTSWSIPLGYRLPIVSSRSIPLDPSPDGDVIHREPTLGQKLLDVAVRKREAQIPADRQENDLRFKLAPLEQAANRRVQKEHPTSLSRQACKVATFPYLKPLQWIERKPEAERQQWVLITFAILAQGANILLA